MSNTSSHKNNQTHSPQLANQEKIFGAPSEPAKRPLSTTIQKSKDEVFALLINIQNYPHFLENLEQVEAGDGGRTTWHFRDAAMGEHKLSMPMMFENQKERDGLIWKATDAAGFKYSIAIHVAAAQAGRGTVVSMQVKYDNVAGQIAGVFEALFGNDAETLTKINLQRFKAFCETGHVPTTVGQPSGREELSTSTTKH